MITLNIERKKSFVGAAMPYRIYVNGVEVGTLMNGHSLSVEIPNVQSTIKVSMVGNAMTFHKLEKEVAIFPEYQKSKCMTCTISTKLNWVGLLTMGVYQPVGNVKMSLGY